MTPPPATFQHTQVFQHTFDLACAWYAQNKRLQKLDRYLIGERLCKLYIELVLCVQRAESSATTRQQHLGRAIQYTDETKILLRLCESLSVLDSGTYMRFAQTTVELGRMLGGWLRHTQNKTAPK